MPVETKTLTSIKPTVGALDLHGDSDVDRDISGLNQDDPFFLSFALASFLC